VEIGLVGDEVGSTVLGLIDGEDVGPFDGVFIGADEIGEVVG
jgi:hypothetical protein